MNNKRVFTLNYIMKDLMQKELDSTKGKPLSVVEGSGALLPALENKIRDMAPGEKKTVTVRVQDAYGHHDHNKIIKFDKSKFANLQIENGMYLVLKDLGGAVVRVAEISDDSVFIDTNHPLAGRDLYFEVEMIENRPATDQEFTSGKAN